VTTNVERTVTTDEDGSYRIIELPPGVYKIRASQTGFGTKETTDLATIAGQNVQLDFSLTPGDVRAEQTVTINDEDAPVIATTRTVVGGTVTQREVEELPNTSRDALDLVFTLGGVTENRFRRAIYPLTKADVMKARRAILRKRSEFSRFPAARLIQTILRLTDSITMTTAWQAFAFSLRLNLLTKFKLLPISFHLNTVALPAVASTFTLAPVREDSADEYFISSAMKV
jgi:hypothetical protein